MDKLALALRLKHAESERNADPLARYFFPSPIHRRAAELFGQGVEVHHRAANYGAKTGSVGAIVTALTRDTGGIGVGTLEGGAPNAVRTPHGAMKLPKFGRPTVGAVLVQSYDGQVDSSQKWILTHLGDHPYHASMANPGKNVIGTLWVKPDAHRSDDWHTWSRLTFFSQENATEASIRGQRWDWVWADEPPVERFWREARKNARYRIITETPIFEPDWGWILKDFEGALGQPFKGRAELVSTLYDNGYLSAQQLLEKEQEYRGDPHIRARLYGEYVNIDGMCPFPYPELERLLGWAEEGTPWELDRRVETWNDRQPDRDYMVILEPSAGIAPTHSSKGGNACAMWVLRWPVPGERRLSLVARYYGWMAPNLLARMGLRAARYYNNALLVPEVNGIGEAMMPELDDYVNLFRDWDLRRAEQSLSGSRGWNQTNQSKADVIGGLINALVDDTIDIPSAPAVKSLMAVRYNDRGRLARMLNQNHEDMMCAGMACVIAATPAYRPTPRVRRMREAKNLTDQFRIAVESGMGRRVPSGSAPGSDRWKRGRAS